jgi:hypothetical protein
MVERVDEDMSVALEFMVSVVKGRQRCKLGAGDSGKGPEVYSAECVDGEDDENEY